VIDSDGGSNAWSIAGIWSDQIPVVDNRGILMRETDETSNGHSIRTQQWTQYRDPALKNKDI
jgi:hypothetical protein